MSFLDNLENNLKNMESQDEGSSRDGEHRRRRAERMTAQASAGYAEQLRKGPFTAELLRQVTRLGFASRTKVNMVWLGTTLRLEARGRKLELRPTPKGVMAVYLENNTELRATPLDLAGNPETLASEWLATLPPRLDPSAIPLDEVE